MNNSVDQIKAKHKKYLIVVFIATILLMVFIPENLLVYVLVVFILLTFLRYGFLNVSYAENIADYLIANHYEDLKKLKISTTKVGFNRIQKQFFHRRKELSELSLVVNDKLDLLAFYSILIVVCWGLTAIVTVFSITVLN